jgi:hypothetical protein
MAFYNVRTRFLIPEKADDKRDDDGGADDQARDRQPGQERHQLGWSGRRLATR